MRLRRSDPRAPEPFRTIVADPAWPYGDKLPGRSRGAARNYPTMRVDEIARYLSSGEVVAALAEQGRLASPMIAPDSRLLLWRVAPMQEEALHVMRAWGFGAPVSEMVWAKETLDAEALRQQLLAIARSMRSGKAAESEAVERLLDRARKLSFSMGRTFRMSHETCLVGRRGRPERLSKSERSVLFAPVRGHSQKPEEFFEKVERIFPGPYLELFSGGHRRPGWTCLGDAHEAPDG